MVLWEITLATAYILGLKRTYRLALKIQRRLVSPKRAKLRQFLHRRTRAVFDVALRVHRNIQQRDIEVGRNLGNWILRWLDRMRPSAQIRGQPPQLPTNSPSKFNTPKQATNSHPKTPGRIQTCRNQDSGRHLCTASRSITKPFPTIAMMMQHQRPSGRFTQCRELCFQAPELGSSGFIRRARGSEGVLRDDIMQYVWRNR